MFTGYSARFPDICSTASEVVSVPKVFSLL